MLLRYLLSTHNILGTVKDKKINHLLANKKNAQLILIQGEVASF